MAFGSIIDVLYQLENLGFFDFILPFLLVFAVVYGVLEYMQAFKGNKAVPIIIAFVLGLLSIRLPFLSAFLTELSPRLGVGLVVLIGLLIMIGFFTPDNARGTLAWVMLGVGAVIFIIIMIQTFNVLNYFGYVGFFSSSEIIGWMVMIGLLLAVIIAIVAGRGSSDPSKGIAPFFEAITGNKGK